jgi:hypothetical protein
LACGWLCLHWIKLKDSVQNFYAVPGWRSGYRAGLEIDESSWGLEQHGQVSQWAFGSQGFESLPRRHFLLSFEELLDRTRDGLRHLADVFLAGFCVYTHALYYLLCVCIASALSLFFFSGVERILSCRLFRKVSAALFASFRVS